MTRSLHRETEKACDEKKRKVANETNGEPGTDEEEQKSLKDTNFLEPKTEGEEWKSEAKGQEIDKEAHTIMHETDKVENEAEE